jgi:hypothetical protein
MGVVNISQFNCGFAFFADRPHSVETSTFAGIPIPAGKLFSPEQKVRRFDFRIRLRFGAQPISCTIRIRNYFDFLLEIGCQNPIYDLHTNRRESTILRAIPCTIYSINCCQLTNFAYFRNTQFFAPLQIIMD